MSIPIKNTGSYDAFYYRFQDGNAQSGVDYDEIGEESYSYPGEYYKYLSAEQTTNLSVPIHYTGSTSDRTFSVILTRTGSINSALGAITTCVVTIKAEPARPPVVFNLSKTTYSVSQGAGTLQIPVSFTNSSRFSKVWIKYATVNGSASSGNEFSGTNSTTVNFAVGANTAVISIPIYNKGSTTNKQFTVKLLASSEGSIGSRSTAVVTILKAKAIPKVTILTTAAPVGIPFTIYGNVSNVKDSEIKSVQLKINGKKMKVKGKRSWKSKVIANSTGRYKMVATVTLKSGKKLRTKAYLSIT